jgi:hypothetical protein
LYPEKKKYKPRLSFFFAVRKNRSKLKQCREMGLGCPRARFTFRTALVFLTTAPIQIYNDSKQAEAAAAQSSLNDEKAAAAPIQIHNATGSGSSTSKRLIGNVMVNDPYTLVVGVVYY